MVSRDYQGDRNIQTFWATKNPSNLPKEELNIQEPLLNAIYVKHDLVREVIKLTHLSRDEKEKLLTVLEKNQGAFQGTKGTWTGKPIKLESKEDSKPFYARPYKFHKHIEKL